MTRKDYELIARCVADARKLSPTNLAIQVAMDLFMANIAKRLKEDNPRFDKDKFYRACGFDLSQETLSHG
jgi:hypothetical protein